MKPWVWVWVWVRVRICLLYLLAYIWYVFVLRLNNLFYGHFMEMLPVNINNHMFIVLMFVKMNIRVPSTLKMPPMEVC